MLILSVGRRFWCRLGAIRSRSRQLEHGQALILDHRVGAIRSRCSPSRLRGNYARRMTWHSAAGMVDSHDVEIFRVVLINEHSCFWNICTMCRVEGVANSRFAQRAEFSRWIAQPMLPQVVEGVAFDSCAFLTSVDFLSLDRRIAFLWSTPKRFIS